MSNPFNPFHAVDPFYAPWKKSENLYTETIMQKLVSWFALKNNWPGNI